MFVKCWHRCLEREIFLSFVSFFLFFLSEFGREREREREGGGAILLVCERESGRVQIAILLASMKEKVEESKLQFCVNERESGRVQIVMGLDQST